MDEVTLMSMVPHDMANAPKNLDYTPHDLREITDLFAESYGLGRYADAFVKAVVYRVFAGRGGEIPSLWDAFKDKLETWPQGCNTFEYFIVLAKRYSEDAWDDAKKADLEQAFKALGI